MKIKTGTAFLLMICLCVTAVGVGAWRGWQEEKDALAMSREGLDHKVQIRVECAYNLLTVASRHLDENNEAFQAVLADRKILENAAATLPEKSAASADLARSAQALLRAMEGLESVQSDARDSMYVREYLPQMLANSAEGGEAEFYNLSAREYNARLQGTFSGRLAGLMGFRAAEEYALR